MVTGPPRSAVSDSSVVGLALALVLVASGCWPFRAARADELREGAKSIVPAATSVVVEEEGDCVELAPSPSCVHVYFVAERGSLPERVRSVEAAARTGGWELASKEFLPGGANLRFARGRLTAVVYLWREERAARCREKPEKDCADVVFVERAG
jgi:hypothetical protein